MKKFAFIVCFLLMTALSAAAQDSKLTISNSYSNYGYMVLSPNFHMLKEFRFTVFGTNSIDLDNIKGIHPFITINDEDYKSCQIESFGQAKISQDIPLRKRYQDPGQWLVYFEGSLILCNGNYFPSKKATMLNHLVSNEDLLGVHAIFYKKGFDYIPTKYELTAGIFDDQ